MTFYASSPTTNDSTFSKHLASFKSTLSSFRTQRTAFSSLGGVSFAALAQETKRKIKWERILRGASTNGVQWKWLENTRHFAVYTEPSSSAFGVLSVGTIKASVQEVASLLASGSHVEYEQKMAALHGSEFKHGAYVADVPYEPTLAKFEDEDTGEAAVLLSVRSATFARPRWLHRDDEWTFLEASQYDADKPRFEKLLTTLTPGDVVGSPLEENMKRSNANRFRGVTAGYSVQPEEMMVSNATASVRVHFYAELEEAQRARGFKRLLKHEASTKAMQQRLLTIAKDCDRLSELVLRRRLGVQVLVDERRVLLPMQVMCHHCDKTLVIPKSCRVCGQGVCSNCSCKYERETHRLGGKSNQRSRVRLETIRVCDPCLQRVESADYSHMRDAALDRAVVFPNTPRSEEAEPATAASDLKELLRDALVEAPTSQRRGAVMTVIRCVLDQDKKLSPPVTPSQSTTSIGSQARSFDAVMLTDNESDYLYALDGLEFETTPYDKVETADKDGRAFALDPTNDKTAPMPFPLTDTEEQRLAELQKMGLLDDGTCDELNIICDIATKELDAFATIVTIITAEEQHIVAANVPTLQNMKMKREESFCQHTIMSDKPLIVPNPEADVRFNRIMPVAEMGIRYYCGFPITSGTDNTVIGTLCCVDQKKHDLTETQFNAMQKLAQTAAKVVRIQGERRRTLSAVA